MLKGVTRTVTSIATALNGKIVVSGCMDGTVRIWDVATGKPRTTLAGHGADAWSVAITADGKTIASTSEDGTTRVWDVATRKETLRLAEGSKSMLLAFTTDGRTLVGHSGRGFKSWDLATGKERATLRGTVRGQHFTAAGKTLVWGDIKKRGGAATIYLRDVATGKDSIVASYEDERIISDAITRDGKWMATGPTQWKGAMLKIWEVASGTVRFKLPGHHGRIMAVAFSLDGSVLASASWDGTVRVWDAAGGRPLAILKGPNRFYCVAFTGDGKTLLAGGGEGPLVGHTEGQIMLWDVGQLR